MSEQSDRDDGRAWYSQPTFLLSAGFLAVVVLLGVWLIASGPGQGNAATQGGGLAAAAAASSSSPGHTTGGPSAPPDTDAPGQADPSTLSRSPESPTRIESTPVVVSVAGGGDTFSRGCNVPAGDGRVPQTPPTGATWAMIGRIAVPTSGVFGPTRTDGAIGNCFQHSPTGALFALIETFALTSVGSDQVGAALVYEERASRTADYDTFLQAAQRKDATDVLPSDPGTSQQAAILGFQFADATADRDVITLAVGLGDPNDTANYKPVTVTVAMVWEDDDWRMVLSRQTIGTVAPILTKDQYIAWTA